MAGQVKHNKIFSSGIIPDMTFVEARGATFVQSVGLSEIASSAPGRMLEAGKPNCVRFFAM